MRTEAELRQFIDDRPMGRLQITVVMVCWLINMLDGFDALAIAYTAPSISSEWGLASQALGIVFSAGYLGMTFGAMWLAPLADRVGRRVMLLTCVGLTGAAMGSTLWAPNVELLIALRFVTGLGVGGMLASLTTLVAEYSPDGRRNVAIAFMQSGYLIGATLCGLAAAGIIEAYGWRAVYLLGGTLTCLMVFSIWLWLPESPHFLLTRRPAGALARFNAVLIRLGQTAVDALPEAHAQAQQPRLGALLAGGLRSPTLLLWVAFFSAMLSIYFLVSWIPKVLVDAGLTLNAGIYAGVATNFGGVIGMVLLGHWSAKRGLRGPIVGFFLISMLGIAAFGSLPKNIVLLSVVAFFIGFFVFGALIGLYSVAARLYPTALRTTGVGWAIGVGRIGAVIGPALGGWLMGLGWQMSVYFVLLALPLVFSAAAVWRMREAA